MLKSIQYSMAKRGNPYAVVRLEPHILEALQERSDPRERGRGGGVSQYLRQLVYSHLGLGDAPCFGRSVEEPLKQGAAGVSKLSAAPEFW